MYHPQNFWDISGARSYQNNVADTADFWYKEIDSPVDANKSDDTLDNKATDLAPFNTVCHTLRHSPNYFLEISSSKDGDGYMTPPQAKCLQLPTIPCNRYPTLSLP
jgi:hypothetical protein